MSYELRHLRCFAAVAEELHFGRAAQRLHSTQPTVSLTIQQLERLTGLTLFDRSSRTVRLTTDGDRLLAEARAVLSAAARLSLTAADLAERLSGDFVVGLHDEGAAELTFPILDAFRAAHPELSVNVEALPYQRLLRSLLDDEVQAVLSSGTVWPEQIEPRVLFEDSRGALVGPRSALFDAPALRVRDVLEEPFTTDGNSDRVFENFWFGDHRNGVAAKFGAGASNFAELAHRVATETVLCGATASSERFAGLAGARYIPLLDARPAAVVAAIPRVASRAQQVFADIAEATARELGHLVPTRLVTTPATALP